VTSAIAAFTLNAGTVDGGILIAEDLPGLAVCGA
jgi:hypothetical protein